jgi:outer membrane autotransporter protein
MHSALSADKKRSLAVSKGFTNQISPHGARWVLISAVSFMAWLQPVHSETLDAAIANQLSNNCLNLNKPAGIGTNPSFGNELNSICQINAGGQGTSNGGNSSTTQVAGTILKRLQTLRSDQKKGQKNTDDSAEKSIGLANGINLFMSAQYESLDRQVSAFENGFNSAIWGFTAGADARVTDWFRGGLAFNYNRWDAKYLGGGGSFDIDSYGPVLFASLTPGKQFYTDVSLSYVHKDYDRVRFAFFNKNDGNTAPFAGNEASKSGGDELGAALSSGYDYRLGNFTIGPRLGFQYSHLAINGYTESGNTGLELKYSNDVVESLRTTLGLRGSSSFNTAYGVVVPQLNAEWVHEFMNDQRNIVVQFAQDGRANPTQFSYNNDRPDRDYFNLGAGVSMVLPSGIQPYLNFQALLGHSYFSNYVGTVGARVEF